MALAFTVSGNLFLLTGIVFGIKEFPGYDDHIVYLIGIFTLVYGIFMFMLARLDGKFLYNRLMILGFII